MKFFQAYFVELFVFKVFVTPWNLLHSNPLLTSNPPIIGQWGNVIFVWSIVGLLLVSLVIYSRVAVRIHLGHDLQINADWRRKQIWPFFKFDIDFTIECLIWH